MAESRSESRDNITVGVRVRPPLPRELSSRAFTNCVAVDTTLNQVYVSLEDRPVIISPGGPIPEGVAAYTFDHCFNADATQEQVYNATVAPSVNAVLQGYNATIFAYGQTGTGKTYTMQNDESSILEGLGVGPRAVNQLFEQLNLQMSHQASSLPQDVPSSDSDVEVEQDAEDVEESKGQEVPKLRPNSSLKHIQTQKSVFVSILQIYNEVVSDLLTKNAGGRTLKLRQSTDGSFFAEGLIQKQVTNTEQVMKQLRLAQSRRNSAATQMNDESSRSHLIMTLSIIQVSNDRELTGAKLNLVDLAGSERVKDSNVTGQALTEAWNINSSLYNLAGVVDALCKKKPKNLIPYRNSKLTAILQDSLGGNCKTTMLACLSPAQDFCKESNNTLKFAHSCKQIQNVVRPNKFRGSIPAGIPVAVKSTLEKLKQKSAPWDSLKGFTATEGIVTTKLGKVKVMRCDVGEPNRPLAVLLSHSFSSMEHQIPAYLYCGYQILYMSSVEPISGLRLSSRAEDILKAGSHAEIVNAVLKQLGMLDLPDKLIGGYDAGSSIALRIAAQWPQRFTKVVAFHPSMGNGKPVKDEMAKITAQVLIQWVPADMFHPWSKWKSMIPSFRNATVSTIKIHPWKADSAKASYSKFSNQICGPVVKFLTGQDPLGQSTKVHKAKNVQMKSTTGASITGRQLITFAEDITTEELQEMMEKPDMQKEALLALSEMKSSTICEALLNRSHPLRGQVDRLLRVAPSFDLESLSTPQFLQDMGIWTGPRNWEALQASPRYFPGRLILIKTTVDIYHDSPSYMMFDPQAGKRFVTHRAQLVGREDDSFIVNVDGKADGPVRVSVRETLEINQPHKFTTDVKGDIVFEDSLIFAVKSRNEKAKLMEIAFKLAPLVDSLDFNSQDCHQKQIQAISIIRSCLDFHGNNVGSEKIMDPSRATTGTVGKLSLHGQGNCHGCSSVIGSYLYHFGPLLGLDVKYRSGFSYHNPGERAHPTMDKHQTIEVTLRPSMYSVIVDLWYERVHSDSKWICIDAQEYYQEKFYPNCILKLGCKSSKILPSDFSF